ncbi:hypothetical protein QQP08_011233 [Theobroma cacao]|nr:hypothetical protein QQP08_011233 [Theobroma cacao]
MDGSIFKSRSSIGYISLLIEFPEDKFERSLLTNHGLQVSVISIVVLLAYIVASPPSKPAAANCQGKQELDFTLETE